MLVDASMRAGRGRESTGEGLLGLYYGRDKLNDNGKELLGFAIANAFAVTNIFFDMRKGGVAHTHNHAIGNHASDFKRSDYEPRGRAHRVEYAT